MRIWSEDEWSEYVMYTPQGIYNRFEPQVSIKCLLWIVYNISKKKLHIKEFESPPTSMMSWLPI